MAYMEQISGPIRSVEIERQTFLKNVIYLFRFFTV